MSLLERMGAAWGKLQGLAGRDDATAATEFGILMPVILIGGLTMADVGLAIHQRMELDHVVRAGAQAAMADPGVEAVISTLEGTASKEFTVASDSESDTTITLASDPVSLSAVRYCACPSDRGIAASCSDVCGTVPPFVFYRMTAAKSYDGIFIPSFSVSREMEVQVR